MQTYANPVTASPPAAYNAKVFGCQANKYNPASSPPACAAHTGTVDADTLMLNSYSNDASGHCDSVNLSRRNAGHTAATTANRPFLTPIQPLFVSSRYTLGATSAQVEGQAISTFSLACNGNGKSTADSVYEPIVAGVDQLRFYFLERTDTTTNSQFQRANGVTNWANVVAVHDVGVFAGQVFVAMEFVRGETLGGWLQRQPRGWSEVLAVFVSAGRGLAAAHEAGLVHRDFKPDNVLISAAGRVRR